MRATLLIIFSIFLSSCANQNHKKFLIQDSKPITGIVIPGFKDYGLPNCWDMSDDKKSWLECEYGSINIGLDDPGLQSISASDETVCQSMVNSYNHLGNNLIRKREFLSIILRKCVNFINVPVSDAL